METDITGDGIKNIDARLLDLLLTDRSTGRNIVWATADYLSLGADYVPECEITREQIAGNRLIRPRVAKAKDKQSKRTRDKAEVFTPPRICSAQIDLIDEQWFGRADVFNTAADKSRKAAKSKIIFPDKPEKTWQDYVQAVRMEITCGEATYLVSRYDAVSGEPIEVHSRIGLLSPST